MILNQNILVSIIIPAYNCENSIEKTIDSVINQSYSNLEIIVIDDGSTDSTPVICDKLAKKDDRLKVIHCENSGVANARNNGIMNSIGNYIAFIDSDDFMHPEMIKTMLLFAEKNDLDIAVCNFERKYESQKLLNSLEKSIYIVEGEEALKMIVDNKEIESYLWNKMFKSELIKNYKIPSEITLCEDLYLLVKICSSNNVKLGYIPESLYVYTVVESGLSHNIKNTLMGNKSKYAYVIQYICKDCNVTKDIENLLLFRCLKILLSQVRELKREKSSEVSYIIKELISWYCRFLKSNSAFSIKVKYGVKCIRICLGI